MEVIIKEQFTLCYIKLLGFF